jgi:CRISPR system Cascade subunit CasD
MTSSGKVDLERTVVSPRYYLADAVFLVGLEGERELLTQIHAALKNPVWPLALGRKSFVPSQPVYLPDGLLERPLKDALAQWPPLAKCAHDMSIRGLLEDSSEGSMRLDQPLAPFAERRFGPRLVKPILFPAGGEHVSHTAAA